MDKLLQVSVNGIKNIENEITLSFSNSTVETGLKKINNVKGIFGYNGAGKSAFITAIEIYRNIVTDSTYLTQNDVRDELNKLINFKTKKMKVSVSFSFIDNSIYRHTIVLGFKKETESYYIEEEDISILFDRTLNGKYKVAIKKENGVVHDVDERIYSPIINELKNADLDLTSFVAFAINRMANKQDKNELSIIDKLLLYAHFHASNMSVFLNQSDQHKGYKINTRYLEELYKNILSSKNIFVDGMEDVYLDEVVVNENDIAAFEASNKKLEKFIRYFKPEIKAIRLDPKRDRNIYHIRRIFVYKDYEIEYEFESSGIKQLVKLFFYLERCAKGSVVFIDEMDTNINSVYFEKLILFFINYGKGQLVFTSHNIEAMNALKTQSKSIVVLGNNNNVDTWVGKGNRSPIKDYINGNFPNSPMNVEDFDFVNIFLGEK